MSTLSSITNDAAAGIAPATTDDAATLASSPPTFPAVEPMSFESTMTGTPGDSTPTTGEPTTEEPTTSGTTERTMTTTKVTTTTGSPTTSDH